MKQGGAHSGGFTIVETLIVLAVSAILAVSVMLLINGRQNKTEFQVAINDLQQQIQQIINETASGYYPNNNNFKCTKGGGDVSITTAEIATQGTNGDCIFIGKVIRINSSVDAQDPSSYNLTGNFKVFPLVGLRDSGGNSGASLDTVKPYALAPGTTPANSDVPDYSVAYTAENGLSYAHISYYDRGGTLVDSNTTTMAVISNFGDYNDAGQLQSGATNFSLYRLPSIHSWLSDKQVVNQIDCSNRGLNSCTDFTPINQARICFNSGTTNQSGLLTIGGSSTNTGLGVSLHIYNNPGCTN